MFGTIEFLPANKRVCKSKVHNCVSTSAGVKVKVNAACIKHKVMTLQGLDLGCRLRDRLDNNTEADSRIHRPPVLCQDPDVRRLKVQSNQNDMQ